MPQTTTTKHHTPTPQAEYKTHEFEKAGEADTHVHACQPRIMVAFIRCALLCCVCVASNAVFLVSDAASIVYDVVWCCVMLCGVVLRVVLCLAYLLLMCCAADVLCCLCIAYAFLMCCLCAGYVFCCLGIAYVLLMCCLCGVLLMCCLCAAYAYVHSYIACQNNHISCVQTLLMHGNQPKPQPHSHHSIMIIMPLRPSSSSSSS